MSPFSTITLLYEFGGLLLFLFLLYFVSLFAVLVPGGVSKNSKF